MRCWFEASRDPASLLCRCFALEEDHEFVYLALEKCKTTLSEALQVCMVCRVRSPRSSTAMLTGVH